MTTDYYWSRLSDNATKKLGGEPKQTEVGQVLLKT